MRHDLSLSEMKAMGAVTLEARRDHDKDEHAALEMGLLDCAKTLLPEALRSHMSVMGGLQQEEHALSAIFGSAVLTPYYVQIAPERSFIIVMDHFHYDSDNETWGLCKKKDSPEFHCMELQTQDISTALSYASEEFEKRFNGPIGATKLWLARRFNYFRLRYGRY